MALEESKREDGIEVVSIVTPNHMHAGPAIEFLQKSLDDLIFDRFAGLLIGQLDNEMMRWRDDDKMIR